MLKKCSFEKFRKKGVRENFGGKLFKSPYLLLYAELTLSGPGDRGGLSGPGDQTHSCQSETPYSMMPKLCDF